MRAFNLTAPTNNASYENAIQAGSLSHTGNSFRPIGSPVKWVGRPVVDNPPGYPAPKANPVRVTQGVNGATITTGTATPGIIARPIAHVPTYRGILGS